MTAPESLAAQAAAGVMVVVAWAHESDSTRVISAAQKAQSERDGGASASSVRAYSVPLVRAAGVALPQPNQPEQPR